MTKWDVYQIFMDVALRIWGPRTVSQVRVVLSDEEPTGGVLASLSYAGRVWAIGNSLVQFPLNRLYTLRVASRLLYASSMDVGRMMVHEALHMGYQRHDANFIRLVREYGGAVSEMSLTDPSVKVERKEGARYRAVASFATEEEARAWAREEQRRVPGRYRLSF